MSQRRDSKKSSLRYMHMRMYIYIYLYVKVSSVNPTCACTCILVHIKLHTLWLSSFFSLSLPNSQCGTIYEVRLIKTRSSSKRANAYAYIEYTSPDPVESALALDRSDLDGRPLFVSRFREKGEKPQTTQVHAAALTTTKLP